MRKLAISYGQKPKGRPPVADLSEDDLKRIKQIYIQTNNSVSDGSTVLAWTLFCEENTRYGHLVKNHVPATTIPTAVREACLQARAHIPYHRGGASRLRSESAYVPGTMRLHNTEERRLRAGEQFSVDDATRNVACWIPWPWGGCKCSEKYGVRLGRWQTLVVHDDASSYIPALSSVFRYSQTYRVSDVADILLRTERDIGEPDAWVLEGGHFQHHRILSIVGGRYISAKGRPNQKLVEGYFNRLWKRMSIQRGDVGRHRGEMKMVSELYVACRNGLKDPRKYFMSRDEAQAELYAAIAWLNEKLIKSEDYGSWVPEQRWNEDISSYPRILRSEQDLWRSSPVAAERLVIRQSVRVKEEGPLGIPMRWIFSAPWLADYQGRKVMVYFNPMDAWPVTAAITLRGSNKLLGYAECANPIGESRDRAAELVKSIRTSMVSEYRLITTGLTERSIRTPDATGTAIITPNTFPDRSQERDLADRTTPARAHDAGRTDARYINSAGREMETATPQNGRDVRSADRTRGGGDISADISRSLDRRAERARALLADFEF